MGEAGELSELVNLVPKNGELVNVKGEKKVVGGLKITNGETWKLLCTHSTDGGKNCIASNGSGLAYYRLYSGANGWSMVSTPEGVGGIEGATAIGNMLVVNSKDSNSYILWKGNKYEYIGEKIPQLNVEAWTETQQEKRTDYTNAIQTPSTESLKALKDTYISELNNRGKEHFLEPFMLRYAYRMYDNSYLNCSTPILMPCATTYPAMVIRAKQKTINGEVVNAVDLEYIYYPHTLKAKNAYTKGSKELETLSKMSDLIKSVDFFISPISLRGDSYKCKYWERVDSNTIICKGGGFDMGHGLVAEESAYYVWWQTNNKTITERVLGAADFYLLKSVPFSDFLKGEALPLNGPLVDSDGNQNGFADITSISTRERLEDSSATSEIVGNELFGYNGRLIKANIKKWMTKNPSTYNYFPKSDAGDYRKLKILVEVEMSGITRVVDAGTQMMGYVGNNNNNSDYSIFRYFFYPHDGAKRVIFELSKSDGTTTTITKKNLSRHPMMVGAYLYNDMGDFMYTANDEDFTLAKTEEFERLPNELSLSNPSNPFVFSEMNRVAVGNGEILGISTSAKALSQGQFGQFPLYVFCSDGIWALEVAEDGTFRSSQPISRDVCNNPDSITQIDGAVVFTTDQGLKMIQGSEVVLLSGYMDGYNVKEGDYFSSEYFKNKGYADFDGLVKEEDRDFRKILEDCRIAYDYPNNMLRIYPNTNKGKYYVFDLGTKEFSSCIDDTQVETVVADYPSSFVQKGDSVYSFDGGLRDGSSKGLLLTRPISLDDPSAFKKLQELKLYQTRTKNDSYAKVCLFVSNDGITWAEKKSLRGGSYRYFRFGVITSMMDDEALSGMAVRYETNRANKLR